MSMLLAFWYICQKVKILGATLNQQLTFQDHVNTVCSASFYHLRSFRLVQPALTQYIAETLGSAVIGAKLDYANSILHGIPSANIKWLQRVQNALARVVLSALSPSASRNLERLHWLPVQYCMRYEVCSLAYQIKHICSTIIFIIYCFTLFTNSFAAFGWHSTVNCTTFSPCFSWQVSISLDPLNWTIFHWLLDPLILLVFFILG